MIPTLITVALSFCSGSMQDDPTTVRDLLCKWHDSNLILDPDIDRVRAMKDHGIPLLARFLADKNYGFLAESAMTEIDSIGAAPYILKNLPNRDSNVQRQGFRSANLLIRQYELSKISGPERHDPSKGPPRWPTNTKPYPFMRELHQAARDAVLIGDPRDTESEVVESIGLTGSRKDIPLLKEVAKRRPEVAYFCVAAEARLGDRQAINAISTELNRPVTPHPMAPYPLDNGGTVLPPPGAVVAAREDGDRMRTAAWQAAFTMNRRFVPLLLKHVDDPPGQPEGDYSEPSPNTLAMDALSTLVLGRDYSLYSAEEWKRWAKSHHTETRF